MEGITFFDGASGKKYGKGCRSSLMTKLPRLHLKILLRTYFWHASNTTND
jgi:hypothetical protein